MADAWDDLHCAFQRGHEGGLDTLSQFERDLYWIMFFIIDFEMGGWEYNWTGEWERFRTVIDAMRRRGFTDLAELVAMVGGILRRTDALDAQQATPRTWDEVRRLIDPDDQLRELHERIRTLKNYGVPNSWERLS